MVYRASAGGSSSGSGSGTVNSGTAPQMAYYATTGTAVSGASGVTINTTKPGIAIASGTVTASSNLLSMTQTWNDASVIFKATSVNVTNTASNSLSVLGEWAVGGAAKFVITRSGAIGITNYDDTSANFDGVGHIKAYGSPSIVTGMKTSGTEVHFWSNGGIAFYYASNKIGAGVNTQFAWGSGGAAPGYEDTGIKRAAAGIVTITDGAASPAPGLLQLGERTAPTGTADAARIYAIDVSGKTNLMCIFGSGTAQLLAAEP